ncbi:heparan-alpha-glucosaminide N-acetyltransferase domain-containing protein [Yimella radicis]
MKRSPEPARTTDDHGGAIAQRASAPDGSGRLSGLDAARGFALIGMVIVNTGPVDAGGIIGRLYMAPYGRASILFVVLAGISMVLFFNSRRKDARRWPTLFWRAGLFLVGGLALQLLTDDVGVILPMYGALFVLALLLQFASTRTLLATAVGLAIVGPIIIVAHVVTAGGRHMTAPAALTDGVSVIAHSLLLSGPYPLLSWTVPFVVGMWVARHNIRDRRVTGQMLLWGGAAAITGLTIATAARFVGGQTLDDGWGRLLTGAAHGQMPLWLLSSIGGAIFVIGFSLRYWGLIRPLGTTLAALGRLALTLYVAHILVIAVTGRATQLYPGIRLAAALVVGLTVLALLWPRSWGLGPMERLIRGKWLRSISTAKVS